MDDAADGNQCTLRAAIQEANENNNPDDQDLIKFEIGGPSATGVKTISPTSALPQITQRVTIDGYTQPGSQRNTLEVGDDAVLNIELDGTNAGSDASGLELLNTASSESVIGGLVINDFFDGPAIHVFGTNKTKSNRIRINSIHSNEELGIDLGGDFGDADGRTPNDAKDLDEGPNKLQNKPVLSSATSTGSHLTIEGRLRSTPSSDFTIRFFTNPIFAPFGYEGRRFIGASNVSTNADGVVTFTRDLAVSLPAGQVLTATATGHWGQHL